MRHFTICQQAMIDEALLIQTVQCDFPDPDSQLRNAFITAGGDSQSMLKQ